MLKIIANNWKLRTQNFEELGRGGEAVIYRLKPDTVAKVYLLPNDPQYREFPDQKEAAKVRHEEIQTKLFDFPTGLPAGLVVPQGVLLNGGKRIFGYTMLYIEGTAFDKLARIDGKLTPELTAKLLAGLYELVCALHAKGVIIGDFNENNIMVANETVYLIDADSMQFGRYQCRSFMLRFSAPELLAFTAAKTKGRGKKKVIVPAQAVLAKPYNELSDWYSFLVIAMRLLVHTDPYGGVAKGMDLLERLRQRITIFDQRVVYPQIARPLAVVPRPLLEAFYRAFKLGERFVPEKEIFGLNRLDPADASIRALATAATKMKTTIAAKKKPATRKKKGRKTNGRKKR